MNKTRFDEAKTNKVLLTLLSILCVALILVSFLGPDELTGPVKQVTGIMITPIQKGINEFGSWAWGITDNFEDIVTLREKNKELQERVDSLTAENTQLLQDREELDQLRELYQLDRQYQDYEKVGARIIARESGNWFSLFTIDKGSADGVKKDMNVISGSGLVGIVTEVGSSWATVRSIIDDNSSVSAMVSTTSDQCVIGGNLQLLDEGELNLVRLTDVDNKVHVGDKVVTSYISEKFLPGILIGYISELNNDSNNMTKSGYVTPVVDFRHLQNVLVVLQLKEYSPSVSDSEDASAINSGSALSMDELTEETQTGGDGEGSDEIENPEAVDVVNEN